LIAVVLGAPSSAARALKAAQLLERGFNSNTGLNWLMPNLVTVESLEPVSAAPPNLRDDMCGPHRKRPATEDEEEVAAPTNFGPDSPYGVFISALHAPKTKGDLLQDANMGEPVLVYTGTRPPAPGALEEAKKPAKKKAVAAKPAAAGKDGASSDAADEPVPKPKPKKPAAKPVPLTPTSAPATSQQTTQMR
jgi:D-alanyl-D-alanine carboxypeptidase